MELAQRRRRDWLTPIWWFLALLLGLDIISILFLLLPPDSGQLRVGSVDLSAIFSGETYLNRPFPMLNLDRVSVIEPHPSLTQNLLYMLGGETLLTRLVSVPMLYSALNLVVDARTSDPFRPAMVRRLRKLGLMVLVLGLASEVVEHIARTALLNISLPDDKALMGSVDQYPSLWWLLPSLVLLGISEVVQRGCDLRDELDGVI